jgi:hypothetical protein
MTVSRGWDAGPIQTAHQTERACRLLAGGGRGIGVIEEAGHRENADLAPDALGVVTPAKAGVQGNRSNPATLDSRFRGNDE